jgi:hypothetical protein
MRTYALSDSRDILLPLPSMKHLHLSKFDMLAFLLTPSEDLASACQSATLSFLSLSAYTYFAASFANLKQLKAITFNSYLIAIAYDSGTVIVMHKSNHRTFGLYLWRS